MQNSPARTGIDVGSVIDDTYVIEALIGRGGMGAVFLASHRRLAGKKVAIKLLHAELGSDEMLARFEREANIASALDHPNIVKVEDFKVLPDGTPYIVYEFLQGISLAQRIAEGPIALDQTFSIVRQLGSALAAAHRAGIVHRDLKPANIFLVPTEVAGQMIEIAKVLDFGISKIRGSQAVQTQESTLLGTPQYMAPEQATGQHSAVDERTDIFALGAIVYEMLSGAPAFNGASIPEVVFNVVYQEPVPLVGIPDSVVAAIARAMAKPALDRFQHVGDFVEALTGQALLAPPRATNPPPAFLSGERLPRSSQNRAPAAFDATVGSGDHGVAATMAAPPPAKPAASVPPGIVTNAPTHADRKKPFGLLVALVIFAMAIVAAGAVYVVTRPAGSPTQPAVVPIDAHVVAVSIDAAAPVAIASVDAGIPIDAAVAKPVAAHVVAAATPEAPGDPETAEKLVAAETAVRAKDYARAEQLANAVITSQAAGPGQRAHGHAIHGIAACVIRHSEEDAMTDLRQVGGFQPLRKRLISICQGEGYLAGAH